MFGWRELHGVGTHMENTQVAHGAAGPAGGEDFLFIYSGGVFAISKKMKQDFSLWLETVLVLQCNTPSDNLAGES